MKVVDPHYHLWNRQAVACAWLESPGMAYSGDNALLPQPYEVRDYLNDCGDIEVEMSVHVEAIPDDPLQEARWLQAQAEEAASGGHPHGIVACADLSKAEAPALLDQLSSIANLRGIRQILNVHANPDYDYVGRHYLLEPQWRANLSRLSSHGWSFDLQLYPAQAPAAAEVIDANPDIPFVLNHAGMFVDRNSAPGWRQWREALRTLAACENCSVKISGLAMFDHAWTVESLRPYVLETIDAFGPGRCMFASNFPVDRLHGSFGQLWRAYAEIVSGATDSERQALFVDNAKRVYRLARV